MYSTDDVAEWMGLADRLHKEDAVVLFQDYRETFPPELVCSSTGPAARIQHYDANEVLDASYDEIQSQLEDMYDRAKKQDEYPHLHEIITVGDSVFSPIFDHGYRSINETEINDFEDIDAYRNNSSNYAAGTVAVPAASDISTISTELGAALDGEMGTYLYAATGLGISTILAGHTATQQYRNGQQQRLIELEYDLITDHINDDALVDVK